MYRKKSKNVHLESRIFILDFFYIFLKIKNFDSTWETQTDNSLMSCIP